MNAVLPFLLTALGSFLIALTGFVIYLRMRTEKLHKERDASTRLLMGLAQDKIIFLSMKYIDRGWVSRDEYHDLKHYLVEPYTELGGNGTTDRVMRAVDGLELRSGNPLKNVPIVGKEKQ